MLACLLMRLLGRRAVLSALMTTLCCAGTPIAHAQDMMKDLDLSSPEMTEAEMDREQVIEALNAASAD